MSVSKVGITVRHSGEVLAVLENPSVINMLSSNPNQTLPEKIQPIALNKYIKKTYVGYKLQCLLEL